MADKIRLLPEVVANQIAAGEVVNRPASVVKEMMENAIDAGATSVKVNFRDGGKDLIQIVDDGCGMTPPSAQAPFLCPTAENISSHLLRRWLQRSPFSRVRQRPALSWAGDTILM